MTKRQYKPHELCIGDWVHDIIKDRDLQIEQKSLSFSDWHCGLYEIKLTQKVIDDNLLMSLNNNDVVVEVTDYDDHFKLRIINRKEYLSFSGYITGVRDLQHVLRITGFGEFANNIKL